MRALPLIALLVLVGCSGSGSSTGGGTGGSGGGVSSGGGTGGTGGGSTGGGTGGATGGGTGGSTGGGAGGGSGGIALADYCTKLAEAQCATAKRCGQAAPTADCAKVAIPTRFSLINARTDCLFVDLRTALTNGTATYHGDKAATCFAAMTTCNVNTQFLQTPECQQIFTGTKAAGMSCRNSGECVPTAYCDSTAAVCPGTCVARVAAGGFATNAGACAAGTLNIGMSDGGSTCQALVPAGGDCTPPPGSFFGKQCQGDQYCANPGDGGTRTCTAPIPAGGPCSIFSNENCVSGTTCGPGADGGQQCVAYKTTGQACDSSGLGIPCLAGLACVNNQCAPLVAANGTCNQDSDCVAGHVCAMGGLCKPFGTVDAGCNTGNFQDDCGVGLFCDKPAAKCAQRRGRDALCPNGNECSIELGFGCKTFTDGGPARCAPVACINP